MLNPGGVFLVNQVLSNQYPASLKLIGQCYVGYSTLRSVGDDVTAYQNQR